MNHKTKACVNRKKDELGFKVTWFLNELCSFQFYLHRRARYPDDKCLDFGQVNMAEYLMLEYKRYDEIGRRVWGLGLHTKRWR